MGIAVLKEIINSKLKRLIILVAQLPLNFNSVLQMIVDTESK